MRPERRTLNQSLISTLALVAGLLLAAGDTLAAEITASVDRDPVSIDESFNLRIKAEGAVDDEPDFSPLEQDFDILGTSQSTSMNFINGNFSRQAVWNLSLISKRAGVLTIPSISFGKDTSPALRITVNASAPATAGKERELFLEVEVDTTRTWVQAQIVYSVRLFKRVNINNASLTPPGTSDADAIVEKLGDDTSYEAFRDGVRYDVIERRYAIFPQHSGTLEISPTRFEGRIGSRRSLFDQVYGSGTLKRASSEALSVEVLPAPAGIAGGSWLPARSVSIEQEWSAPVDQLEAGEPVTRTITIRAGGVLANQVPDIAFAEHDSIKQYPDQPQNDNRVGKQGVDALKQVKIALIPAGAGRFTLPAVELPWWNTVTGERELASLPAVTLEVSGAPAAATAAPPPLVDAQAPVEAEPAAGPSIPAAPAAPGGAGYWPWISLALACGWLLTLALLWRQRRGGGERKASPASLRKQVLAACAANDADACKAALLAWAQAWWPQHRIHNLMDIAPLVDSELADAIRALNSTLYSDHAQHWDGGMLARALAAMPTRHPGPAAETDLIEPLYRA